MAKKVESIFVSVAEVEAAIKAFGGSATDRKKMRDALCAAGIIRRKRQLKEIKAANKEREEKIESMFCYLPQLLGDREALAKKSVRMMEELTEFAFKNGFKPKE